MASPKIKQIKKESALQAEESTKAPVYYLETRDDLQALMDVRGKRVLDVGCAAGEMGHAIKLAGALEVMGIERNIEAAAIAEQKLDKVFAGDVEDFTLPPGHGGFDYIIFADVLEHTRDPWSVLAAFRQHLRDDGRVVASIPNIRFYSIIARLIFNRWRYLESGILDSTHLRFFTLPTIKEMFERAGFQIERVERKYRLFEDQSRMGRWGALTSRLFCRFIAPLAWRHFFTFQYVVVAKKTE